VATIILIACGIFLMDPYWTFVSHARLDLSPFESGGDDGARTRDLCRDRV
jgi:hypothetical protein